MDIAQLINGQWRVDFSVDDSPKVSPPGVGHFMADSIFHPIQEGLAQRLSQVGAAGPSKNVRSSTADTILSSEMSCCPTKTIHLCRTVDRPRLESSAHHKIRHVSSGLCLAFYPE